MSLGQTQTTSEAADCLESWLDELPILWHTVDLYEAQRKRKRVCSRKCPRSFEAFIGRFNVLRRQDGMYQGKFGGTLLLMVKASHPTIPEQCLVAGIGLPRRSPLNDVATLGLLGGLLHDGLSRIFLLETLSRRAALLKACASLTESTVAVLERTGTVVEYYSGERRGELHERVIEHIRSTPARRGEATLPALIGVDGEGFGESRQRWLAREPVIENHYAAARITPPRAHADLDDKLQGYGLSDRELQVARLVFDGRSNKVIADSLFISRDTVKTHCRRIFAKMGISRRTQALAVLGRHG